MQVIQIIDYTLVFFLNFFEVQNLNFLEFEKPSSMELGLQIDALDFNDILMFHHTTQLFWSSCASWLIGLT
jgi:hypothetical protein